MTKRPGAKKDAQAWFLLNGAKANADPERNLLAQFQGPKSRLGRSRKTRSREGQCAKKILEAILGTPGSTLPASSTASADDRAGRS